MVVEFVANRLTNSPTIPERGYLRRRAGRRSNPDRPSAGWPIRTGSSLLIGRCARHTVRVSRAARHVKAIAQSWYQREAEMLTSSQSWPDQGWVRRGARRRDGTRSRRREAGSATTGRARQAGRDRRATQQARGIGGRAGRAAANGSGRRMATGSNLRHMASTCARLNPGGVQDVIHMVDRRWGPRAIAVATEAL
jgi:hypothetical protein